MRLKSILYNLWGVFMNIQFSLRVAFLPTVKAIFREPSLLFKPLDVRRVYMAHVWAVYADGADEWMKKEKTKLVCPNASGIVLDVGAGYGHLAKYLDKQRVTAYIALEPNSLMHETLRKKAREAGFVEEEGTFLLIEHPAESIKDVKRTLYDWANTYREQHHALGWTPLSSALNSSCEPLAQVDTIVSVLSLCSIPSPTSTLRDIVRDVLSPGGQFLFYEHVRNPLQDIARVQDIVAPLWKHFFDGCVVGLNTVEVVREAGLASPNSSTKRNVSQINDGREDSVESGSLWASTEVRVTDGDDLDSIFLHQVGKYVKKDNAASLTA